MKHTKELRALIAQWAWWRRSGRLGAEVNWPKKTITGKFLDDMPGTHCPTCSGRGKLPGARLRIPRAVLACPTCGGQGRVALDKTDPQKINPAFVRPTGRHEEEEAMLLIDRLICALRASPKTEKYFFVLWSEYVSHKHETQEYKAGRMGITHSYFRKLLSEAHALMGEGLKGTSVGKRASNE